MIALTVTRKTFGKSLLERALMAERRLQTAVDESAAEIQWTAQNAIMNPPKTGVVYKSGPQPLPHQASAPGEAPANWTGALEGNIEREADGALAAKVSVKSPYGAWLEFGTVRIAPRPFFIPAIENTRPSFLSRCNEAFSGAVKT